MVATKMNIIEALHDIRASGMLENTGWKCPEYLLPAVKVCSGCGGDLALQHQHTMEVLGCPEDMVVLINAVCACGAVWKYDRVIIDGQEWRITQPREFLTVSDRSVIRRSTLHNVEQRLVIQANSFQSEGEMCGIERRTLRRAVFLDFGLRHYREVMELQLMPMGSNYEDFMKLCNNHVRRDGLPSRNHCCTDAGAIHVSHMPSVNKMDAAKLETTLRSFEAVVVTDGHEKVCRRVCQNFKSRDMASSPGELNVPQQCTGTPYRDSPFCQECAFLRSNIPKEAHVLVEEDDIEEDPIALRTRMKKAAVPVTTVSEQKCTKTFHMHKGHTTGVLVTSHPCHS